MQGSAASRYSPVRVSQSELIELAGHARALSLRQLRIRARKGGDRLSPLRGRGMEFDESRPYQPGDDPRNIDWRVTARQGKPFTKVFREERERPVLFLMDLRASMHFATRGAFKSVVAARLAALLAWAAHQHGDRVGGFLFAEDFHRELRPRVGQRAVLQLIHETVNAPVWEPQGVTREAAKRAAVRAFAGLRQVEKSGSLVVLLSDGRHLGDEAVTLLADIGRNNDVVLFQLYDPIEAELPPAGRYRIVSGGGPQEFSTTDAADRARYRDAFDARQARLQDLAKTHGLRFVPVSTDTDAIALARQTLGRPGR